MEYDNLFIYEINSVSKAKFEFIEILSIIFLGIFGLFVGTFFKEFLPSFFFI